MMKIEVEDIQTINLKPNDTLVVRYEVGAQPASLLRHFADNFNKVYPNNNLMFLPASML